MVWKTVQSRFDSSFLAKVNGIEHDKANNIGFTELKKCYAKDPPRNGHELGSPQELLGLGTKLKLRHVGAFNVPSSEFPTNITNQPDLEVYQEIADLKSYESHVALEGKSITIVSQPAPSAAPHETVGKTTSNFAEFLKQHPETGVIRKVKEHKPRGKLAAFLNKNVHVHPEKAEQEQSKPFQAKLSLISDVEVEVEDDLESEDYALSESTEPIRRIPEMNTNVKRTSARQPVAKTTSPKFDQERVVLMIENWFNSIVLFLFTVLNFFKDLILGSNQLRVKKEKTRSRGGPQSGRRSHVKKNLRSH